jgi:c-di-GMP-binding flagellar brake protein YcgR
MTSHDRRYGNRIPMELMMNEYVHDRPYRALSVNISETGVYVNKVVGTLARRTRVVGLEFELPGTAELIWARGEICYDTLDDCFHGQGIRFTGIPKIHQRLIRDYCIEKRRAQLSALLERIRRTASS